jgi:hypothetical protein
LKTKYMHYVAALATLALAFPLGALARDRNEHSLQLFSAVQVGNTQLEPGNYEVQWQGDGPAVQVSFQEHGKTVATIPATLKANDNQVIQDDIVTTPQGNTTMLKEIDFGHQKDALVF